MIEVFWKIWYFLDTGCSDTSPDR